MKEIKFRAWDKQDKEMLEPFDLYSIGIVNGENGYDPKYYILLQYTGLKDKNGKEIYEGDILLMPVYPSESNPNGEPDMGVVGFTAGAFGWRYLNSKGKPTGQFESFLSWNGESDNLLEEKVIGNIYENPELLKAI